MDTPQLCILIVDDEPMNIRTLEGLLYGQPYELMTATSGAEALMLIEENPPDLILLDVMMPQMNGLEVCQRLKSNPNYRLIPIVIVTALSEIADRVKALEAGADDFLSKPVDGMELIARVRSLLRVHQLYAEIERATAERLRFMAGVAHDLRSPLSAVLMNLDLLAKRLPADDARIDQYMTRITSSVDHIRMLADDIMRYHQIEGGHFKLNYVECGLPEIIEAVLAIARPLAEQAGIALWVGDIPDCTLQLDKNAVIQIMVNLMTNAIKYTQRGGQVQLRVNNLAVTDYQLPDDHHPLMLTLPTTGIAVEIEDNGMGIGADEFDRVFSEFDRLRAEQRGDTKGVGLGLPVSQRLVRLHGGEIWFSSHEGQGSIFGFYLPLQT